MPIDPECHRSGYDGALEWPPLRGEGEARKAESVRLQELIERSANLPEGEVVGALLRWQRGDGYAFYVVTKARPLTVKLVPTGDAWQVEAALIRGLTRADVLEQLASARALASIFERGSR